MATDILLDESGDLDISGGDLTAGESTQQHIRLILLTQKGQWKDSPVIGADIARIINNEKQQNLRQTIQKELEIDGLTVRRIELGDTLEVEANYRD
jgi:phage baseplate assembly protein W